MAFVTQRAHTSFPENLRTLELYLVMDFGPGDQLSGVYSSSQKEWEEKILRWKPKCNYPSKLGSRQRD
jgi:hypothetical protein